jgi:hypothetical protein
MKKLYDVYPVEKPETCKDNVAYIDQNERRIAIDMIVTAKTEKTAYKKFYNALAQAQENGFFGEYDLVNDILAIAPDEYDDEINSPWVREYEDFGYKVELEWQDENTIYVSAMVKSERVA